MNPVHRDDISALKVETKFMLKPLKIEKVTGWFMTFISGVKLGLQVRQIPLENSSKLPSVVPL
jgi:hypothetical protein